MTTEKQGPIDPAFIAEVLALVDLAELAGETVTLRKRGREHLGRCPFHDDRAPSFTVNPEKGLFNCFGCGAAGDAAKFVMLSQGLSFPEAIAVLARRQGIEIRRGDRSAIPRRPVVRGERLHLDGEEPAPLGAEDLERLARAQQNLDAAAAYLAKRRIPLELVASLGGGVMRTGDNVDRLILPHTNPAGEVVSVYGRRIDDFGIAKHLHMGGRPKGWLNAPAALTSPELWICEGAFDALALMASGITGAVAVFGVQGIRWRWLKQVRRIVLAFDCDAAGQKAIEGQARQALLRGVEVMALTAPELGGCKDVAEAWAARRLHIGTYAPLLVQQGLQAKVSALPDAPPFPGLPGDAWAAYRYAALRLAAEHVETALQLGWTERELFAVPAPGEYGSGGALWILAGRTIVAAHADRIVGDNGKGVLSSAYRENCTHSAQRGLMPWQ